MPFSCCPLPFVSPRVLSGALRRETPENLPQIAIPGVFHFAGTTDYSSVDKWWERNFYIMGNINRATEPGDRLLLLIGAGHRAVLKDFFEDRRDVEYVEIREYLE